MSGFTTTAALFAAVFLFRADFRALSAELDDLLIYGFPRLQQKRECFLLLQVIGS